MRQSFEDVYVGLWQTRQEKLWAGDLRDTEIVFAPYYDQETDNDGTAMFDIGRVRGEDPHILALCNWGVLDEDGQPVYKALPDIDHNLLADFCRWTIDCKQKIGFCLLCGRKLLSPLDEKGHIEVICQSCDAEADKKDKPHVSPVLH